MSSMKKFGYKKDFMKNKISTFKGICRLQIEHRKDMKTPFKNHHNRV
jgi:hypothetical protein